MTGHLGRVCAACGTENPAEARFCFSCGAALEVAAGPSAESRKTVTVLFCDLVGSTAMGEQLDPETMRSLLGRSFDTVSAIVESHGGVVEKFIGDAAMAVFGIPRVHEDDALRAVRAAAEIRDALQATAVVGGGATVAWRTGIATGEVVAGDATAGHRLVTGDAVNVAARLQQTAQPGEILITAETHQLVRDAVLVEALGDVTVKGRQAPIEAIRLLEIDRSAAGHERRLDSPMVGRERPRRLLDDAFAEVRDQRVCHLFTILGAAGVGKSRLVDEFVASLGEQAIVVRGRCLSYGEGITYWPVAEIVRGVTGMGRSPADPVTDLARIRAVLGVRDDADRIAELIGQAIGLGQGQASPEETPWAIQSFLETLAAERPLVAVLDDLQWGQPLLLDLVEHVSEWSHDTPILLVVVARPELLEMRPTWGGGKRHSTTLSLDPLNAEETAELVENLLGRAELPASVFDRIREAAEGNPLFVEELLDSLIDDGVLAHDGDRWAASRDLASVVVPPTIQALLAARIDGLGAPERTILERGSVEGTVFHRDAVAELAPDELRENVDTTLLTLTRREFVAPDRGELAGREAYRFRHQLIHDAAYQAIAKQSRAELHERFADWLESVLGDRLAEYRPIVGYHLEQASRYRRELDPADPRLDGLTVRAGGHLRAAGIAAQTQLDHAAAVNLFRRGLDLLPPESAGALEIRLMLADSLGDVEDARVINAFLVETVELANRLHDPAAAARAEVARIQSVGWLGQGEMVDLLRRAQSLQQTLEDLGDEEGALVAGERVILMLFWMGRCGDALEMAQSLLPRATGLPIEQELWRWTCSAAYFGPTPVDEAMEIGDVAVSRMNAGVARLMGLRQRGALLVMLGRFEEARTLLLEEQRQLIERGMAFEVIENRNHLADLAVMEGRPQEAANWLWPASRNWSIAAGAP
jgi:class 3 adenylate cyclase